MKKAVFLFVPALFILYAGTFAERFVTPYEFPKPAYFPAMPVSDVNPVSKEGAELGRYLFYDPVLSSDSTISCAGCHRQEVAFSDAPKQFSAGVGGELQVRNTLPLFNLAWYPSLFWDGRAPSLERQVFQPVSAHGEMNLEWNEATRRISRSGLYVEKF